MLDTVILTAPAVQIVPGLIRYTWLIPKELLKLVLSTTKLYAIPNPVQRYWVIERSSEYTVGVPQSSTKEGELHVY